MWNCVIVILIEIPSEFHDPKFLYEENVTKSFMEIYALILLTRYPDPFIPHFSTNLEPNHKQDEEKNLSELLYELYNVILVKIVYCFLYDYSISWKIG